MSADNLGGDEGRKALYVGTRDVRDLSNAIGSSFDINALRRLDVVDEDGNLTDDGLELHQAIYDDGTIEMRLLDGDGEN